MKYAGEAILITTPDGKIVYANPAFERITGYTADEAIGRTPRLLKSGRHNQAFYEALWGTILAGEVWRAEVFNRRKDGVVYAAEHCIAPVLDKSGRITHFVAISQEITARKELEAQLRQAQKMEAMGRLASGVAHDFNNLLTVIMGRSEILTRKPGADKALIRDLSVVQQAALRGASLTRQLLAFSRKQALQPAELDLGAVVTGMALMLRRLIGEHIEMVTRSVPGLGSVVADRGQIEQVILNLAVNARDAMPQGGRITIEASNVDLDPLFASRRSGIKPGPYALLSVSDTGVGMDEETRSHIFEPFFTTKAPGKGTGLGLATVYGIVTQSGGHIEVQSEPGHGAKFTIYLPRLEAPAETSQPELALAALPKGTETVLVVEDEEDVREVTREILEGLGYTVLAAPRGDVALRLCERYNRQIDLLLTDVVMPGMSGREVAARIASLKPEVKVLYTSGHADDVIARYGVSGHEIAFLQKPFTPDGLARRVRDLLDAPGKEPE